MDFLTWCNTTWYWTIKTQSIFQRFVQVKSHFFSSLVFRQENHFQEDWARIDLENWLWIVTRYEKKSCLYIKVFYHFFKQSQTEPAVLNVFQDLKSKISEKSDQNWECSSSALLGWGAAKIGWLAVFGCFNLFLTWSNLSFGPNFLKFWIWCTEIAMKL